MMDRKCEICESPKERAVYKEAFSTPYLFDGKPVHLIYKQCLSCGFVYLSNPIKKEDMYSYYTNCGHMQKRDKSGVYKGQYNFIVDNLSSTDIKSVLDIGCGDFDFLNLFGQGIDKYGNDVRCVTNLIEKNGVHYVPGFFNDIELKNKVDLICFRHVLEHLVNIGGVVSKAKQMLSGDGFIYIEVPDLYYFKDIQFINTDFNFEHTNYFTLSSLSNLLIKYGFDIVNIAQVEDLKGMPYGVLKCLAKKRDSKSEGLPLSYNNDLLLTDSVLKIYNNRMNALQQKVSGRIESELNNQKFAVFGAGGSAIKFFNSVNSDILESVEVFVDNDPKKIGRRVHGKPIISPSDLSKYNISAICIMSVVELEIILKQLREIYGDRYKIVTPFKGQN